MAGRHLILWDGTCGLCRRVTEWVSRKDAGRRFDLIPFQEAPSPPMTPGLRESCRRAVHVITDDGRVLRAGRASLFVAREIGYPWTARLLSIPPLVWLVEVGYRIVARNRPWFAWLIFPPRRT
jgi:predicted DCC family thiol-disulfide oxidoreductase YuxK